MDYDDSLERAMENTPDVAGSGERFQLPDPDVRQEGNVTVFENFPAVVDRLDRDRDHVMRYVQTELGTSASIDDRGRLRLTGEFRAARLGTALQEYAEAYVLCPECGLPDTTLEKEHGTEVRQCSACGARSATGN
ncbi:translation initiation factor IF-2 subunit beta [Salinirubellus salinus]|uniref:Translation initiation factor IF-2 subunit beta n=1 Tax=Salinirubellus salinus TaxID=1364945 RepID=A0A9E7R7E1_9EURY|nr:translation initiation factor IF-2 subunit beta [Salinirubellus salinus]UWM56003.1 translation initiation factor IF-2 subunit beta [Salinirubellus salinus]